MPFLKYNISANVVALSTKRHLRISNPYSSFNLNPYCGDNPEKVARSREWFCERIGVSPDRLVMPHQVHGVEVRSVDNSFFSLSDNGRARCLEGVDALTTDLPNVFISVSTADCIPVLIYDERTRAMAAIHAGWRGTVQNIVGVTLRRMTDVYGTSPSDCHAVIGPGISLDSFEVGDEVYEAFRAQGFDMEQVARRYPSTDNATGKWHIDLWEANRLQLLDSGVPSAQVQVAGICTYKNVDSYFSARRLGIASGRITTGIMRLSNCENPFP